MTEQAQNRWVGLKKAAQQTIQLRDYSASSGESHRILRVEANVLLERGKDQPYWIAGVEIFPRQVYQQNHRGAFAELSRQGEGILCDIGLWPQQWAASRMHAGSAKGFHIHPPTIPADNSPEIWFQELFAKSAPSQQRPYQNEQWDVMYILQGRVEMILVDERAGLPRCVMGFFIDGDDIPGPNNVGVVIPPGVAHAMRVASSTDALVVYGTSTPFDPANEGRIFSEIEEAPWPEEWEKYLGETTAEN